ncbi:extracellular solute-binding protein [Lichenihabitans sp. PAMC28606]|uniref:extracellular solute-binding protein n=1 Tax=Lichenihabitans sp. PAMC28606 TaxID=2880932 RepID=UPI001D0A9A00|nr:extracellular solute-binding protein [Lichenihabitans sp. PAMC28606]UDL96081.1 extracellular solute-binding protein [Lichenihabitans sp. PAMC28606]
MSQDGPMMPGLTRRAALALGGTLAAATGLRSLPWAGSSVAQAADGETEQHGISIFGELGLPSDFKSFDYVDPNAPKGGSISLQVNATGGNQNFDTFDTLNIYILRGNGAAGMGAIFDTLMTGSLDEPDALYGLVARTVRWSADRLTYRFVLRPEARFHDGSKLTAADVAFSLNLLKTKGHPVIRSTLRNLEAAEAEGDDVVMVRLNAAHSRELPLIVAGQPIFSKAFYTANSFEEPTLAPPLGSGAYTVGALEQGRHINFDRVKDYWAKDLPVNVGQNNFDTIRYEYFRERQIAFEAFKSGVFTFREDATSIIWAQGYDFPAAKDGRVKRETIPDQGPRGAQGWFLNTRRDKFKNPKIREALGLCFDFNWTNQNIMFGLYQRTWSYFQNTPMAATGKPGPDELALLDPLRDKLSPDVFEDAYMPPTSDGSGQDRALLARAFKMLQEAGCKRDGSILKLPDGQPFTIEFLDYSQALERHTAPFIKNLRLLGIEATFRLVDTAQFQSRTQTFDFDVVTRNNGASFTPGEGLRVVYGSDAAKTPGSLNLTGISDPIVDLLIDKALVAATRPELETICRSLDRVLRAGHYWVPMWNLPAHWLAYWDIYDRPKQPPKFDPGVLSTWWVDPAKAARVKLPG